MEASDLKICIDLEINIVIQLFFEASAFFKPPATLTSQLSLYAYEMGNRAAMEIMKSGKPIDKPIGFKTILIRHDSDRRCHTDNGITFQFLGGPVNCGSRMPISTWPLFSADVIRDVPVYFEVSLIEVESTTHFYMGIAQYSNDNVEDKTRMIGKSSFSCGLNSFNGRT